VQTQPSLTHTNRKRALATLEIVGLDKHPFNKDPKKRPTSADLRWKRRQETWRLAEELYVKLQQNDTNDIRELIVQVALPRGLFSIWMKVFENDSNMCFRFVSAFKGTSPNCFNSQGQAIKRVMGKI
jgi:hypothetical protein